MTAGKNSQFGLILNNLQGGVGGKDNHLGPLQFYVEEGFVDYSVPCFGSDDLNWQSMKSEQRIKGFTQLLGFQTYSSRPGVPRLDYNSHKSWPAPADEDFWELQSKNIWGPKAGNHGFLEA